jgi:carboxymethylenebutenolidase
MNGVFKMAVETIKIKTSDHKEYDGFISRPEKGNGAGTLLIQEIFGVNEHIRDVAELYAQAGYTILAPDFFWRTNPGIQLGYGDAELKKGIEIAQKLDWDKATQDLIDAVETLRKQPGVNKIGAVGYCMGGTFAYGLACRNAVDAAVSYYGGGIDQRLADAPKIKIPLLMHFASDDEYIPATALQKIKQALAHAKPKIYIYNGVHHGFNCDQRASYDRKSAMLAFARSLEFFNRNLGVSDSEKISENALAKAHAH